MEAELRSKLRILYAWWKNTAFPAQHEDQDGRVVAGAYFTDAANDGRLGSETHSLGYL